MNQTENQRELKGEDMRSLSYFYSAIMMIGMVLAVGEHDYSMAHAKAVEAGDSSSSWIDSGKVLELGHGDHQVIHGLVKGILISRHTGDGKLIVHSSKLACPVRVNVNEKNDYKAIAGLCTLIAHEGKNVAYAQWQCVGTMTDCKGEFAFTGGAGGFSGVSGTTPFETSILFEAQEGKHVQAIGYAVWPNLMYALP
jgi:hypothetical protein